MKELTINDVDALKQRIGYQTGAVAVDRETLDALIAAWESWNTSYEQMDSKIERLEDQLDDANCACEDLRNTIGGIKEILSRKGEGCPDPVALQAVEEKILGCHYV